MTRKINQATRRKDDGKLTICPGKNEISQLMRYKVREARALPRVRGKER